MIHRSIDCPLGEWTIEAPSQGAPPAKVHGLLPDLDDQPRARIVGRYALYDEIASGGMATVHYGRLIGPIGFSRTVAIKRLHPHFARDPEFVAMFVDEARLAARIRHPNVVPTLDVVATDGELFLVMDYVQGESLSRLLRASRATGAIPIGVASAIFCGALHGLHAAHEATDEQGTHLGLVHRDMSPQNILVGVDGIARVLDFGVAMAAGRAHITGQGKIKGKLGYIAPEQISGSVTRQSDLFATAVVLWEVLTGKRLFAGDGPREVIQKVLTSEISPPTTLAPHLPRGVDAVVMRGLERDPQKRYSTAREMAIDIERCLGLASPTQVGAWVESVAREVLAHRAAVIAEIESSSSRVVDVSELLGEHGGPPIESGISLTPRNGRSISEPASAYAVRSLLPPAAPERDAVTRAMPRRGRGQRVIAWTGATLLGASLGFFVVHRPMQARSDFARSSPPAIATSAATAIATSAATAIATSAATAIAGTASGPSVTEAIGIEGPGRDAATPPPAVGAIGSLPAATGTRVSIRPLLERGATTMKARAVAQAAAPPTHPLNCDPPFTLDPQGHKIWIDECFRRRSP